MESHKIASREEWLVARKALLYNYLDLTPKGRNEKTIFDWVRRHDDTANASGSTPLDP
jgi:predicted dithiol-disulfide oxidoreductase (DUF899 family)